MIEAIVFPVVLLGSLDPELAKQGNGGVMWGTAFGSYSTVDDCGAALVEAAPEYWKDWPTAVFWCAEVVMVEAPERNDEDP